MQNKNIFHFVCQRFFLLSLFICSLFIFLSFSHPVLAEGFTVLRDFSGLPTDGTNPWGDDLINNGDVLFGVAAGDGGNDLGTIFSINTDGTNFTLLHEFSGIDGSYPYGSLAIFGDMLYGTASYGGSNNFGTIFSINTDGTNFTLLHEFSQADGIYPYGGSLTLSSGTLYGMTTYGGANNLGTIFSINTDGTNFTLLHEFSDTYGSSPFGSLTLSSGTLYGMTTYGGANNLGTIFSINTDGTNFTLLHEFSDGLYSEGSLTLSGNILFGMTTHGGVNNFGTIFSINTDGTNFTLLHEFSQADGEYPYNRLALSENILYGTTDEGGDHGFGTLFSMGIDGTNFRVLHSFDYDNDGGYPGGSTPLFLNNTLYGMAGYGGANDFGTIFSYALPELPSELPSEPPIVFTPSFNPRSTIKVQLTKNTYANIDDDTFYTQIDRPVLKGKNTSFKNGTAVIYQKTDKGGTKRIGAASIGKSGSWDFTLPKGKDTTNYFSVKLTDQDNNSSDKSFWFKLIYDRVYPYFIQDLPDTLDLQQGGRVDFLAKDDETGIDHYTVKLIPDRDDNRIQQDSFYILPDNLQTKIQTLLIKAYDKAGNKVEKQVHLTITPKQEQIIAQNQEGQRIKQQIIQTPQIDQTSVQGAETDRVEPMQGFNQNNQTQPEQQTYNPPTPTRTFLWWNPWTW